MNSLPSLVTLRSQCTYQLNVDVAKGDNIIGGFGKKLYAAKWLNGETSPIILLEIKGNDKIREVLMNITLEHPNIIKTFGMVGPNGYKIDSDAILLLQEYAKYGDLGKLLMERHFIPSQYVLLEIFIQISSAMVYLASHHVLHGDLACRNVLVLKSNPYDPTKNVVKLIDFGLTLNENISSNMDTVIPVRYVATEILRSNGKSNYSQKSDVYAFGTLMWEACSFGQMPYANIDDDDEVCRRKLAGLRLSKPKKCDPNLWRVMEVCWNENPRNRPTFNMIHEQFMRIHFIQFPLTELLIDSTKNASKLSQNNSCSFNIEYYTCEICEAKFTDKDSHWHYCPGNQQACENCKKKFQFLKYEDHTDHCIQSSMNIQSDRYNLSRNSNQPLNVTSSTACKRRHSNDILSREEEYDDTSFTVDRLSSFDSLPRGNSFNNEHRSTDCHRYDAKKPLRHEGPQIHGSYVPSISSTNPFLNVQRPKVTLASLVDKQPNTTKLPCDICKNLIDVADFLSHERQCKARDDRRIEHKRRQIERQQPDQILIECKFCHETYSNSELENHENNCNHASQNMHGRQSVRSASPAASQRMLKSRIHAPTVRTQSNYGTVRSNDNMDPSEIRRNSEQNNKRGISTDNKTEKIF